MEINSVTKCKCKFLSVQFEGGASNCMRTSTYKKTFGHTPKISSTTWACNNCANHWNVENGEQELGQEREFKSWVR